MDLFKQIKDLIKDHIKKDHNKHIRKNSKCKTPYVSGLFWLIMHDLDADDAFKLEFVRAVYNRPLDLPLVNYYSNKHDYEHTPELNPVKDLISQINDKLASKEITYEDLREGFRYYNLYDDKFFIRVNRDKKEGRVEQTYIEIEKDGEMKCVNKIYLHSVYRDGKWVDLDFKLKREEDLKRGVVYDRVYLEGKIRYWVKKQIMDEDDQPAPKNYKTVADYIEGIKDDHNLEEVEKPIIWTLYYGNLDMDTINVFKEHSDKGNSYKVNEGDPDFYAFMVFAENVKHLYDVVEEYAEYVQLELKYSVLKDPYTLDQLTFRTGDINCVINAIAQRLVKKKRTIDTFKLVRMIEQDFNTIVSDIELGVTIPDLLEYKARFQPNMAVIIVDALGDVIRVVKADVEGKDTFNLVVQCGANHCEFIDKDIRIDRIVSDNEFGYQMQINTFDISIDVSDICAKEYIIPTQYGHKDDLTTRFTSTEPIPIKPLWKSSFINGANELYYKANDKQQRLILVKSIYPILKNHRLNVTKINTMRNDIIGVKIAKVTDEQIKQELDEQIKQELDEQIKQELHTNELSLEHTLDVILRYIDPSLIKTTVDNESHKVKKDLFTIEEHIEKWNKTKTPTDKVIRFIRKHTQNCYLEDALILKDNFFVCRLKFCRLLFEKTGNPRFKEFKGQSFGSLFKMLVPDFKGTPNNQIDYLLRNFHPRALVQYSNDLITGIEYEGLDINRAYTSVLYNPESKIPVLTPFDELHPLRSDEFTTKINPDFAYLIKPIDLDITFNNGDKLHIDASIQTGTTILKMMKHGLKLDDITHEIRYTQYLDKDYFKKYVELMYEISEHHLKDKSKYECDAVKYQYGRFGILDPDDDFYDPCSADDAYDHFVNEFGYPVNNIVESELMAKQAINEYTGLLGQQYSYTNRAGIMTTAEKYAMDKPGHFTGDSLKSYNESDGNEYNIVRGYTETPLVQHCLGAYVSIVSQGIGKLIDLIDELTPNQKIIWVKVDCVHYVHAEDGDAGLAGVNLERLRDELENPQQKPKDPEIYLSIPKCERRVEHENEDGSIDYSSIIDDITLPYKVKFVTRLEDIGKYKKELSACHARSSLFSELDQFSEPATPEIPELENRVGYIIARGGYGKTWRLMQLLYKCLSDKKMGVAIAEENSMITNMQNVYYKANAVNTDRVMTIDKFLGNVFDDNSNKTETITTKELIKKYKTLDYLYIDEFATVSRDKWNKLISLSIACGFQIIAAGDPFQCTPPGDSSHRYDADYHINVTKMQIFFEYDKLEYLEECARYKLETKAILDEFITKSQVPDHLLSDDVQMFNIVYTNKMRVYINQLVSNAVLEGVDESQIVRYHSSIDKIDYSITAGTVLLNKGSRVNKSTFWTIEEIDEKGLTLTSEQPITDPLPDPLQSASQPMKVKISYQTLKTCYVLGYAATINSVQGKTVKCKYAILECARIDKNRFYTALSRCEDINNVTVDCCICTRDWIKSIKVMPDYIPKYTESFIYAIRYTSNKWYIGKTINKDERAAVHYQGHADEIIENTIIWSGVCTGKEIFDIETYFIQQYVNTYGNDAVTNIQKVKDKTKEKYEAKTTIEIKTTKEVKITVRDRRSQGKGTDLVCKFTIDRLQHQKTVAFGKIRTMEQAKAEIQQWLNTLGKELNATLVLIDEPLPRE
jgi:hypothetical protein